MSKRTEGAGLGLRNTYMKSLGLMQVRLLSIVAAESGFCRLSERQKANGGLNGRPEKLEDVS